MTIFLEVAKQCLQKEIDELVSNSQAADQSYVNGALNLFGYGRNTELSAAKRQLLTALLGDIQSISVRDERSGDYDKADSQSLEELRFVIERYRKSTAQRSAQDGYNNGGTGAALPSLTQLVTEIFNKFEQFGLLDLPRDAKPYHVLCYHMAFYLASKISRMHKESEWSRVLDNPQISVARMLSSEKEDLIQDRLKLTKKSLNSLKDYESEYEGHCIRVVSERIEELQRQNMGLYDKHGLKPGVPIRLSLFGSAAQNAYSCEGGALGEALRRATAEINTIPISPQSKFSVETSMS